MLGPTTLLTALLAAASLAAAMPLAGAPDHQSSSSSSLSPVEERGLRKSGALTWYTEGMGVSATACGAVHKVTEHVAALSPADYGVYANPNNSPVCGRRIRIHGRNGRSVVARVVDRCAGCAGHDVDVTPVVFTALGYRKSRGRVGMTWNYI